MRVVAACPVRSSLTTAVDGGGLRCWGGGQPMGYGNLDSIPLPALVADVPVGGPTTQATVGWSAGHICALLDQNNVRCWGWGAYGILGYGHISLIGDNELADAGGNLDLGKPAFDVEAGRAHSCALLGGGTIRCWGQNSAGGLGYGHTSVEMCDDGNMIDNDGCPNNCGINEVGCMDILTNMNMWGQAASGVDLRAYTNSTLHWIGCPTNGCLPNSFYCNYDAIAHTMQFGTTSQAAMRSVVDPNDVNGDVMPNAGGSCCTANTMQLCNAPDSNNNGVNVVMVEALCASLGYSSGTVVRQVNSNVCPQAHVTAADGLSWNSDYVSNAGFGAEYLCSQN